MELRRLLCFVTVAEELHFARAADRLHMSCPPLSLQIRRLEEELELELFCRDTRNVRLTAAGATVLEQARIILERVDGMRALCHEARLGMSGPLKVGTVPIDVGRVVSGHVARFRGRCPDAELTLAEMATNEQLHRLRHRRLDIGFVQSFEHDLHDLVTRTVISEPFWLAVPARGALAGCRRIPIDALAGINVILPPRSVQPGIIAAILGSCRQAGFRPRLDFEVSGARAAFALVSRGLGVAPAPRSYSEWSVRGVAFRPVSAAWPRNEIDMVWAPDAANPLVERFTSD